MADDARELRCEVAVLGAGPGGYTAAFRAADLGKRVVLIERDAALGGVCLNVGCIPSKTLLHLGAVLSDAEDLREAGVELGQPSFDLDAMRRHKDRVVRTLTDGLAKMAKQRGVEVVTGEGTLATPNRIEVVTADGRRGVSFDQAILAAGSRAVELPFLPADDPRVMDSAAALEVEEIPERLLVIGGGIIGLEMATVYDAFGSQVTVVELLDELMAGVDRDLVRPLERRVRERYAAIRLDTKVTTVDARDDGLHVAFEGGDAPATERFDRILVAVGRRPNGDRIGADRAGVRVDERGFVPSDERQRTNVPHLYAIGDLTGEPLLAHKATHEGVVAAEAIAGLPAAFDAAVPSVAYTDPEVAWVGLTERAARERGVEVRVARFPWSASGRALGIGRSEGLTKLIFDAASERLVGAGIVGRNAGDLIAETTLAIEMGADAEDVALTVHPHPTLSETIAFAAEVAAGTVTDLPPRR